MSRVAWHSVCLTIMVAGRTICAAGQLQPSTSPEVGQSSLASPPASSPPSHDVSWKRLLPDIVHDQKTVWTFPARLAEGKHWKPTLGFVLTTASLVALDSHDTPYFRRTSSFRGFNKAFSGLNTGIVMSAVPLGLVIVGHGRKRSSTEKTGLLATEALLDAEIVSGVIKNVDRRLRPSDLRPNGDFDDTWFKAKGGILVSKGSFPSGHAIGAFALASVVAGRYRAHRWVPWLAYGVAGTIAFSRLTLQAHFPSDLFAGAALGYCIGHFVVLRPAQ